MKKTSNIIPVGKDDVDRCSSTEAGELCRLKNCSGSDTAFSPTKAAVLF